MSHADEYVAALWGGRVEASHAEELLAVRRSAAWQERVGLAVLRGYGDGSTTLELYHTRPIALDALDSPGMAMLLTHPEHDVRELAVRLLGRSSP